jgi:hypothetical protein
VSGLQRVVGTPVSGGSNDDRTATATCPTGKLLVSGGFQMVSAPSGTREPPFVMASYPSSTTVWTVEIQHGSITRPAWTVTAYAMCASA